MGRRARVLWFAGAAVAGGAAVWAVLRFGLLSWLGDADHPARPAVEALSWVSGIGGLVVAVVALAAARRGEPALTQPGEPAGLDEARERYFGQLAIRFGRVDADVLLPPAARDDLPPMALREVFVAQSVRANPPPVELPREVVRRLAAVGELDAGQFPEDLGQAALDRVRHAYLRQPRRPVLTVLGGAEGRRAVVLGDPGTGKSSLARYLCLTLAAGVVDGPLAALSGSLPMLVELRTYADPRWRSGSFLDLLEHLHVTENLGLPSRLLEEQLHAGTVLMIFDGLDRDLGARTGMGR